MYVIRRILFFLSVYFFAVIVVGQERSELQNIKRLVELNHFLTNLEDPTYQLLVGLSEGQSRSLDEVREIVKFHLDTVLVPENQIVDEESHRNNWSDALVAIDAVDEQVEEILLPFQFKLYKFVETRTKLGIKSSLEGFATENTRHKLSLSDTQIARIKQINEELNQALKDLKDSSRKPIKKMLAECRNQSLEQLNKTQKEAYKSMLVPDDSESGNKK